MRDFELSGYPNRPDDTYMSQVGVLANADGTRSVFKRSRWTINENSLAIIGFLDNLSQHPHPNLLLPETYNGNLGGELVEIYSYVASPTLSKEKRGIQQALMDGRLSGDDIVRLMLQLTDALSYIHQLGLVHTDVRATNIFVRVDNDRLVPTLFDYGNLCRPYFRTKGIDSWNPEIPPELRAGNVMVDQRTDVYMLGHVLSDLIHYYGDVEIQPCFDPTHPIFEVARSAKSPLNERYPDAMAMHTALQSIPSQ